MKKIQLLIPTLLTAAVTPVIALSSCGNDNTDPVVEEPTFIVDSSTPMESETKGVITLNWEPNDHSIICSNFQFTYGEDMTATVTPGAQSDRPLSLELEFTQEIYSDISNGTLKFHYVDSTVSLEKDAIINNINIKPFEPEGLDIICDQIGIFEYEHEEVIETYDVVQSNESTAIGGEITTFGVDLTQYGDDIQDTAPIFFGAKKPVLDDWPLIGLDVESIGSLYLGDTELTEVSGSGGEHTYWIEIKAPAGGWKAAISASTDGYLTGSYIFNVDFYSVVLMFGQLQQA